jgi:hypothetical protein
MISDFRMRLPAGQVLWQAGISEFKNPQFAILNSQSKGYV